MPITEDDIRRFTSGDCHFLAKRLNRAYGLPMYAFNSGGKATIHAFVMYEDLPLDVRGLAESKEAFIESWGVLAVRNIIPLTPQCLKKWKPKKPLHGRSTYKRARIVADLLMADL